MIAEAGFEGLRTRAVADRAGVNIATLHYYFPSKQALIEGLAQFLGAKFVLLHGPAPEPSGFPAVDRLRQEFSDGRFYFEHEPKMLLVMEELGLRGKRDAEVRKVVEMMQGHWRRGLEADGGERACGGNLPAGVWARKRFSTMLMCMLSGAASWGDEFGTVKRGIERWLLTEEVWKATRGAEHERT